MNITPLEIRKHPFRKVVLGGIDAEQVDSFLAQIAGEVEELRRENATLATNLKEAENDLVRYKNIENTLNETLLTAQRATDDAKANAQKEAELILRDAQMRADRYENESRDRANQLSGDIRSLAAQKESFLARFRSMLRDQLTYLEVMSGQLGEDKKQAPTPQPTVQNPVQ